MKNISFFTPVSFGQYEQTLQHSTLSKVDHYLSLSGKKAVVITKDTTGSSFGVRYEQMEEPFYLTALKVASYFTVILPLIALVVKAYLRHQYTFHLVGNKKAQQSAQTPDSPVGAKPKETPPSSPAPATQREDMPSRFPAPATQREDMPPCSPVSSEQTATLAAATLQQESAHQVQVLETQEILPVTIRFDKPYEIKEGKGRENVILLENGQVWEAHQFPDKWKKGEKVIFSEYRPVLEEGEVYEFEGWYTVTNQTNGEERQFQLVHEDVKTLTLLKERYINTQIQSIDSTFDESPKKRITLGDGQSYYLLPKNEEGRSLQLTWSLRDSVRVDTVEKKIYNHSGKLPRQWSYHE